MSFKAKLLVFILCLSLIPICILTGIYYFTARSELKKEIFEKLTAVAEAKKNNIETFLDAKKGRVVDFSSDGFIRDSMEIIDESPVAGLVAHLSKNKKPLDSDIEAILVLDRDGKVVASSTERFIGKDMADQDVFTQAIIQERQRHVWSCRGRQCAEGVGEHL